MYISISANSFISRRQHGFIVALCVAMTSAAVAAMTVDRGLPAGNITVNTVTGNIVHLDNELRDTASDWFYWAFRVRGAAGRRVTFVFDHRSPVGVRGPCVSGDRGRTWTWTDAAFTSNDFIYEFPPDADEVWFANGMTYTQRDWEEFLTRHAPSRAFIKTGTLCISRRGRPVEKARIGCVAKPPHFQVWLSARHHAQEMMASYVLEGILDAALDDTDLGRWLRDNVEFLVVPFVDKDGVEDGDQGKNRAPHDHNRDYSTFLYPECRGITNWITTVGGTRPDSHLRIALDLHCPWIRGPHNESVYQVYTPNQRNAARQEEFGKLLAARKGCGLNYRQSDDIRFGQGWNNDNNYRQGRSFKFWALDHMPATKLVTTFEIPFANANGTVVTRESCRRFGTDIAAAIRMTLEKD